MRLSIPWLAKRGGAHAALFVVFAGAFLFVTATDLKSAAQRNDSLQCRVASFKIPGSDSARVDVYCSVPYGFLSFFPNASQWVAKYSVHIVVKDQQQNIAAETRAVLHVRESHREPAVFMPDKRDMSQSVVSLLPGEYQVFVELRDDISNRTVTGEEYLKVPLYMDGTWSMSSLLCLSAVEQRAERLVITPYISTDLSSLSESFFVFCEVYANQQVDTIDLSCELYDGEQRVWSSVPKRSRLLGAVQQEYLRVQLPSDLPNGEYQLRCIVRAKDGQQIEASSAPRTKSTDSSIFDAKVLCSSSMSVLLQRPLRGPMTSDIDKAIRQLRYIATQEDMDRMSAPKTVGERRKLFEHFWKSVDPSPGTQRNEAFDEYFARVDYCTKNFQSYAEGWLSDMGMVYIVLGPPESNRRQMSADGRTYIQWNYAMPPRQFLFIDYSSFGDYRLSTTTPFSSFEKYRYRH